VRCTLADPRSFAYIRGWYIKAFSETDFTEDLKKFYVPTLIIHGDDDQIVPIGAHSADFSIRRFRKFCRLRTGDELEREATVLPCSAPIDTLGSCS
jgi:pimeloyl-ACP methyl ester carboxylesterase